MWIADYITKNSASAPCAVSGNVVNSSGLKTAVNSSVEHKDLKIVSPYGVYSVPPKGENAVVLPLADCEVCIGVTGSANVINNIEPGEILLKSKGGASIFLKNDGFVYINGAKFGG